MADSIPRAYLKEITDALAAEPLYVAFFKSDMTGYDELAASSLYSGLGNESTGTGYTAGGIALTSLSSAAVGTENATALFAAASSVTNTGLTARYAVIYNHTTSKIRAVKDFGSDQILVNGTFTVTWDSTNGLIKISFT